MSRNVYTSHSEIVSVYGWEREPDGPDGYDISVSPTGANGPRMSMSWHLSVADARRLAETLLAAAQAVEVPPPVTPCKDCGKPTDAGPCPLCGAIVCQLCAEREGAFCCPAEEEMPST